LLKMATTLLPRPAFSERPTRIQKKIKRQGSGHKIKRKPLTNEGQKTMQKFHVS